jgi:hypothetical protein
MALSPRANYTDWATATCRRNLLPTFVNRRMSHGQRGGSPTVVNVSFLDRSLIYSHKGWVDPVPDPLLLRKSGNAGNRTRDLWVSSQELWPLDYNFVCGSIRVWSMLSDIKGGTLTEGIWEEGVDGIFGQKRDEMTGGWRKLHNEKFHNLYSSPSIIRIIRARRMQWARHVMQMGTKRTVYRLIRKPEGKR